VNRTTITIVLFFLVGCDSTKELSGKEEAGSVAISCITQLESCDDWTPINMAKDKKRQEVPTCEKYDHLCEQEQDQARDYNREIDMAPTLRSPCQQRIDSCVDLVRALVGAPVNTEIHHHDK